MIYDELGGFVTQGPLKPSDLATKLTTAAVEWWGCRALCCGDEGDVVHGPLRKPARPRWCKDARRASTTAARLAGITAER